MPTHQLTLEITESAPKMLYGLKINKDVLQDRDEPIENIINLLGISETTYVVGLDEELSETNRAHYHIHFLDSRNYEALRKHKGRNMRGYGTSTKLYQAKKIEGSDFYVWYGYACKEQIIMTSHDVDIQRLKEAAAVQAEAKKHTLKYESKKAFKEAQKQEFIDKLFKEMQIYKGNENGSYLWWATKIYEVAFFQLGKHLTKTPLEIYTWQFLIKHNIATASNYINYILGPNANFCFK